MRIRIKKIVPVEKDRYMFQTLSQWEQKVGGRQATLLVPCPLFWSSPLTKSLGHGALLVPLRCAGALLSFSPTLVNFWSTSFQPMTSGGTPLTESLRYGALLTCLQHTGAPLSFSLTLLNFISTHDLYQLNKYCVFALLSQFQMYIHVSFPDQGLMSLNTTCLSFFVLLRSPGLMSAVTMGLRWKWTYSNM